MVARWSHGTGRLIPSFFLQRFSFTFLHALLNYCIESARGFLSFLRVLAPSFHLYKLFSEFIVKVANTGKSYGFIL